MSYKIVVDSCCDLTEELKSDSHFQIIPLTLQVGETYITDDEHFDQARFLELVRTSPECPRTACPSPEAFRDAYDCDADMIFVVTLSQHLSGTYNSAVLGRTMYRRAGGKTDRGLQFGFRVCRRGEDRHEDQRAGRGRKVL